MKKFLLLCLLCFLFVGLKAQTTIQAKVVDTNGLIHLYAVKDHFSMSKQIIGIIPIDEQGEFFVNLPLVTRPQRIEIHTELYKKYLFVEPNGKYEIVMRDTLGARLDVIEEPESKSNFLIKEATEMYTTFYQKCKGENGLNREMYFEQLPEFITALENKFEGKGNAYFQRLINSYIGQRKIELWIRTNKPNKADKLALDLINSMPVNYQETGYVQMIRFFHKTRLNKFGLTPTRRFGIMLSAADVHQNDTLKELAILDAYVNAIRFRWVDRSFLLEKLSELSKGFRLEDTQQMAQRIVKKYSQLIVGDPLPKMSFETVTGDSVSWSDFEGKLVYLDCFGTWCAPCVQEMKEMPPIVEKFKDKVHFVALSFNDTKEELRNYVKLNEYDWPFLFGGINEAAKNSLQITSFPTYILLNERGEILDYPAKRPRDPNFEKYLKRFIENEKVD